MVQQTASSKTSDDIIKAKRMLHLIKRLCKTAGLLRNIPHGPQSAKIFSCYGHGELAPTRRCKDRLVRLVGMMGYRASALDFGA